MVKDNNKQKNNQIEERIKSAFDSVTPDIFTSILESLSEEKGMREKMENILREDIAFDDIDVKKISISEDNGRIKKSRLSSMSARLKRAAAVAAAVCLVLAGGFGVNRYNLANAVESVITVDVNPSIEISVNAAEKVLEVRPLNDDAKIIVGEMDFSGSSLEVTFNALIGSMLRNGYISDSKNSILLSVDNTDEKKGEELKTKLATEIDKILIREKLSGAIISTALTKDSEIAGLAEKYGITQGKAKLIKDISDKSGRYSFEDLVSLSINELNLIADSPKLKLTTVSKTGLASDSGYIGKEAARNAALKHAGLSMNQVYDFEMEMDYVQGVMVYEMEFKSGGAEYEYDINANTGAVVKVKKGVDDDYIGEKSNNFISGGYDDEDDDDYDDLDDDDGDELRSVGESQTGNKSVTPATTSYIGKDRAEAIALSGAGVRAADVVELEVERERENGTMIYEVSFRAGDTEYNCKVDAVTGKLLRMNKEIDDDDYDDLDDDDGDYDEDNDND